jgi:hypothetical protein
VWVLEEAAIVGLCFAMPYLGRCAGRHVEPADTSPVPCRQRQRTGWRLS